MELWPCHWNGSLTATAHLAPVALITCCNLTEPFVAKSRLQELRRLQCLSTCTAMHNYQHVKTLTGIFSRITISTPFLFKLIPGSVFISAKIWLSLEKERLSTRLETERITGYSFSYAILALTGNENKSPTMPMPKMTTWIHHHGLSKSLEIDLHNCFISELETSVPRTDTNDIEKGTVWLQSMNSTCHRWATDFIPWARVSCHPGCH